MDSLQFDHIELPRFRSLSVLFGDGEAFCQQNTKDTRKSLDYEAQFVQLPSYIESSINQDIFTDIDQKCPKAKYIDLPELCTLHLDSRIHADDAEFDLLPLQPCWVERSSFLSYCSVSIIRSVLRSSLIELHVSIIKELPEKIKGRCVQHNSHVEFSVFLYRSRVSKEGVVIELQRRRGCPLAWAVFQSAVMQLLVPIVDVYVDGSPLKASRTMGSLNCSKIIDVNSHLAIPCNWRYFGVNDDDMF